MSSYKVSEPSALKFLKANGAVVDENGNVSDWTLSEELITKLVMDRYS